jgi:hypothetical protein
VRRIDMTNLNALHLKGLVEWAAVECIEDCWYSVLNAEVGSIEVEDRYNKQRFVVEVRVFEVEKESE